MDIIVSYGCFILTDWQIFSSIGQDKTTLTFLRADFRVFDPTSVTTGLVRDLIHFIYLTFAPAWYALPINKSGDDHRPYYSLLIINGKCNIARNTSKNNLSLLSQFSLSRSYELWLLYLRKTTFHCFKKFCSCTRFVQDLVWTLKQSASRTVIKMPVCRQRKDASPTIHRWIGWGFCEQ